MGQSVLIDIIGSMTTFGLLLITTLQLNASASESNYAYNQNYLLQRNMVVLTTMLEDDLRHIGAGVYDQLGGILLADSSDIIFRTNLPPEVDGKVDQVEWKLESTQPPNTPNTRIYYLSRTVNNVKSMINFGVTQFKMQYWSVYNPNTLITPLPITNTSVPSTGNIGPMSVTIRLESPYWSNIYKGTTDTSQYQMVWRQIRSVSRNNSIQFQ